MPTVIGDGDIYKELVRLLIKYDKALDEMKELTKEKIPYSRPHRDFLAISYRLGEINVNGKDLAEAGLVKKLLERK